jgi:DNA topoisomerase-1
MALTFKATGVRTLFKGFEIVYGEFDDDDTALLPGDQRRTPPMAVSSRRSGTEIHQSPGPLHRSQGRQTDGRKRHRPSFHLRQHDQDSDGSWLCHLQRRRFHPTENGIRTTFVLNKYFPEILSTEYTANMENELDKIEEGKDSKLQAMNEFYGPFMDKYTKVQDLMYKDPAQPTGEMCPVCGSPLVIKKSRYGSFVACSNYPKCKYIKKEPKAGAETDGRDVPGMREAARGTQGPEGPNLHRLLGLSRLPLHQRPRGQRSQRRPIPKRIGSNPAPRARLVTSWSNMAAKSIS